MFATVKAFNENETFQNSTDEVDQLWFSLPVLCGNKFAPSFPSHNSDNVNQLRASDYWHLSDLYSVDQQSTVILIKNPS